MLSEETCEDKTEKSQPELKITNKKAQSTIKIVYRCIESRVDT